MNEVDLDDYIAISLDDNRNYYKFDNKEQVFTYLILKILLVIVLTGFSCFLQNTDNPFTYGFAGLLLLFAVGIHLTIGFWDFKNPTIQKFIK